MRFVWGFVSVVVLATAVTMWAAGALSGRADARRDRSARDSRQHAGASQAHKPSRDDRFPLDSSETPNNTDEAAVEGPLADDDPLVPPAVIAGLSASQSSPAKPGPGALGPDSMAGHDGDLPRLLGGSALDVAEFAADERAEFHPHGEKLCASGCALSNHPTPELSREQFQQLLSEFAFEPLDETSPALEALLFYGRQSRQFLEATAQTTGSVPLDSQRAALLALELKRTHARLEIRVIDEGGEERVTLPPTRVPLSRRHVFRMQTHNVQPLVTSGTVKRVGLYHLWTRL